MCIKNDDERVLTQNEEISNRWREYFSNFLMRHMKVRQAWEKILIEKMHNFHCKIGKKKLTKSYEKQLVK